MIRLARDRTQALLAIHGGSAVLLGLLLYAVIVTGVASVFAAEIDDWSSPLGQRPAASFPVGLDRALHRVAATVDPQFRAQMFAVPEAGGRIKAFFHRDEKDDRGRPVERGVAVEIDPGTMTVLARREGTDDEIDAREEAGALGDFMIDWHVQLHLAEPWGLLLTGVLGLAMLVAAVTGFLIHRHLLGELFTLRRRKGPLLRARDRHVLAGSWTLPFGFILAFTGSYFSFASSFGIPLVAQVVFGGDQDKMMDTLVGIPPATDPRPAAMSDLDAMIADAGRRSAAAPSFLQVENWGRADARVTVFTEPSAGRLISSTYVYQGASGTFRYRKPGLGLVPSLGSNLFDLMGPLHFGDFAGTLSKAVWFALGFAMAYVVLSGLSLWLQRRREDRCWQRLGLVVTGFGYGLPLALVGAAYGYFLARTLAGDVHAAMMDTFAALLAGALALTMLSGTAERTRRTLIGITALALLGLPLLRLLCGGLSWAQALTAGWRVIPALDSALILAGLACLATVIRPAGAAIVSTSGSTALPS